MYVSPDNTGEMRPNLFKSTLPAFNRWDLKKGTKYIVHDRETVYLRKKHCISISVYRLSFSAWPLTSGKWWQRKGVWYAGDRRPFVTAKLWHWSQKWGEITVAGHLREHSQCSLKKEGSFQIWSWPYIHTYIDSCMHIIYANITYMKNSTDAIGNRRFVIQVNNPNVCNNIHTWSFEGNSWRYEYENENSINIWTQFTQSYVDLFSTQCLPQPDTGLMRIEPQTQLS